VGKRVWQLDFANDEKKLYTTNGVSGDVSIIDVESLSVEKTIKVGRFPWGLAVIPEKK
jgi:YVTN family beta-propeller protein